MDITFFKTNAPDIEVLMLVLFSLSLMISLLIYGNYRYQWFLKIRRFKETMDHLGLDANEESLMTAWAYKYKLKNPKDILSSLPLFDQMMSRELEHLMLCPAPSATKEQYIEMIYDIRRRTFFQ